MDNNEAADVVLERVRRLLHQAHEWTIHVNRLVAMTPVAEEPQAYPTPAEPVTITIRLNGGAS